MLNEIKTKRKKEDTKKKNSLKIRNYLMVQMQNFG